MKISKGTLIRTIMVAIVVINLALKQFGIDVINVSENDVSSFIEMVVSVATIVLAWWKNNSFSERAIQADNWLHNFISSDDGKGSED